MSLPTARFDYPLPPEAIAQEPIEPRDHARLLVVDRARERVTHHRFHELPQLLPPRTRLFRNVAKVLPARLQGQRPTGGAVECLLLRPLAADPLAWECLLKPARKFAPGDHFDLGHGLARACVEARQPDGTARLRFQLHRHRSVTALAQEIGAPPLPPYIAREATPADASRYDTVYADPARAVAAAAPTAGLHFTPELLQRLAAAGFSFHDLLLHVGLGTFRPIQTEDVTAHRMHGELYEIPAATRPLLAPDSAPRLCVGTTTLRAIEDYARRPSKPPAGDWVAEANLFLYPPAEFHADALITNFHLPRSTLVVLVSALASREAILDAYAEAVQRGYRFYSYGDAMWIR